MNPVDAPQRGAGMMAGTRTTELSIAPWRGIIHKQPASGLTVAAFCRPARVSQASFFAWRRKLRVEDSPRRDAVSFADVKISRERACAAGGIELGLPGRRDPGQTTGTIAQNRP